MLGRAKSAVKTKPGPKRPKPKYPPQGPIGPYVPGARKREVLIQYVLDETGSMASLRDSAISGFNEYVDTLRTRHKKGASMSLILFNTEKGAVRQFSGAALTSVPALSHSSYLPNGATQLYDAIAEGIRDVEEQMKSKNQDVVFVIHTDGEENSSRRETRDSIFDKIEAKKKFGWVFVFLGADQDAWAKGGLIGTSPGNSLSYDNSHIGTRASFTMAAQSTSNYIGGTEAYRAHAVHNLVGSTSAGVSNTLSSYNLGDTVGIPVDIRKKKRRSHP